MKKILIFLLFSYFMYSQAQENTKLMATDSIKFFKGSGVSIWGNFYNSENISTGGSLILEEGVEIIMYGDTFKNINASKIDGGGEIIMTRPRPFPYTANGFQVFDGGGTISSVPDLTVNSPNNVELKMNDLRIRDSLKFIVGKLILNQQDLVLGDVGAGVITGYDENKYIVTNGNTLDTLKGYLIRENIDNNNYVFPVGINTSEYNPAIINNSGTTDRFKVRVFDTVYEDGYTRNIANSFSVAADDRSIKRTWDIREGTKGGSNVNLTLQYNTPTEGTSFNFNRNYAFISHFVGYNPNTEGDTISNWKWDNFKRASTGIPLSPGTITSGSSIGIAAMKSRNNITSFSPFTITTWEIAATPLPIHFLAFNAQWKNNIPYLNWAVADQSETSSFTIYRSNNNLNFEPIANIPALAQKGIQTYQYSDFAFPKNSSKLFYKIKANEANGFTTTSEIKVLSVEKNTLNNTLVYPNPAADKVNILLENIEDETNITLTNYTGKIIFNTQSINQNLYSIDVSNIAEGTYLLTTENSIGIYSTKLLVIHK